MKLFYGPAACSIGIHVVLEEIGKPYEAVAVLLKDRAQYEPDYVAINPKSKVPALQRDDGSVLTEYSAIAYWLAVTNPAAGLWPAAPDAQARVLEAMDYAVATMHMQGFSRMFRPSNYAPSPSDHDAVKARGREMFERGFALMEASLGDREWVAGSYSIADTALFYVSLWAARMDVPLPPACAAHYARMKQRPAVQRVLAAEGLS